MSLHLQRFVDRVQAQEARGARDLVMSMAEAKDLHADITRLLLDLQSLREIVTSRAKDEVITITVDGGKF